MPQGKVVPTLGSLAYSVQGSLLIPYNSRALLSTKRRSLMYVATEYLENARWRAGHTSKWFSGHLTGTEPRLGVAAYFTNMALLHKGSRCKQVTSGNGPNQIKINKPWYQTKPKRRGQTTQTKPSASNRIKEIFLHSLHFAFMAHGIGCRSTAWHNGTAGQTKCHC